MRDPSVVDDNGHDKDLVQFMDTKVVGVFIAFKLQKQQPYFRGVIIQNIVNRDLVSYAGTIEINLSLDLW